MKEFEFESEFGSIFKIFIRLQ